MPLEILVLSSTILTSGEMENSATLGSVSWKNKHELSNKLQYLIGNTLNL